MAPKYTWMRPVLAGLSTVAVILLTGYLTYKAFQQGWARLPKEMLMVLVALVQTLILSHRDGNGFYFGTSQGSANKAATIDKMVNGLAPPPEPTEPKE